jgi:hypothetical protein
MCRKNAGQCCVRLNQGYSRLQNRSSTLLKEACYAVHHEQSGQSKGLWKGCRQTGDYRAEFESKFRV